MDKFDVTEFWIESRVRMLHRKLTWMRESGGNRAGVSVVEDAVEQLEKASPGHPEIQLAIAEIEKFKHAYPEEFGPLPTFRPIGSLNKKICPTCNAALTKEPQRKTTCKACGSAIWVRQRPLDRESVLLRQCDLKDLEEDWIVHYKDSIRQPREISPEAKVVMASQLSAGPREDSEVEDEAQRVMSNMMREILQAGTSPRDALQVLIAGVRRDIREQVASRVSELQAQAIFGRSQ